MNKKSFFLGVVTGVVLTFAVLFVIGLVNQNSRDNAHVQYLEKPVSYENKSETSFKVIQVIDNATKPTDFQQLCQRLVDLLVSGRRWQSSYWGKLPASFIVSCQYSENHIVLEQLD